MTTVEQLRALEAREAPLETWSVPALVAEVRAARDMRDKAMTVAEDYRRLAEEELRELKKRLGRL